MCICIDILASYPSSLVGPMHHGSFAWPTSLASFQKILFCDGKLNRSDSHTHMNEFMINNISRGFQLFNLVYFLSCPCLQVLDQSNGSRAWGILFFGHFYRTNGPSDRVILPINYLITYTFSIVQSIMAFGLINYLTT